MFICDISIFNKYGKQKLDEMLRPLKIDWHELVIMLVIEQVPGISQARLIPFLQTDKANITKLLQAMEKKQLIRRDVAKEDQRNKVCNLTSKGERMTPKLHEVLKLWEEACFQGISSEELMQFRKISERIAGNLIK